MSPQPEGRSALHAALAAQQKTITTLSAKVDLQDVLINYISNLAGVGQQVTAIRKRADIDNPAQPVDNPPSEPASESTEEAATPEARDNVSNPGMTPGSVDNIAADSTDVVLAPGESLPTEPFNDLQNVQAPVSGTETQLPLNQTRIETDVRVGDPTNPTTAYPWTLASAGGSRTTASIRLARLQIMAGMEQGDDLVLGSRIAASQMPNAEIESTIRTLEGVQKAASARQQRPANLVPRSASVQRTTPSLTGGGDGLTSLGSVSSVDADTADADLFD